MFALDDKVRDLRSGKTMIVVAKTKTTNGIKIGVTDPYHEHQWKTQGKPLKFRWTYPGLLRFQSTSGIEKFKDA